MGDTACCELRQEQDAREALEKAAEIVGRQHPRLLNFTGGISSRTKHCANSNGFLAFNMIIYPNLFTHSADRKI